MNTKYFILRKSLPKRTEVKNLAICLDLKHFFDVHIHYMEQFNTGDKGEARWPAPVA